MWVQGMLELRNSNLTAVRDVVDGDIVNLEEFGIEEEGPVPNLYSELVTVPQSSIQLSEEEEGIIQQAVAAVPPDDNGIMAYTSALTSISTRNEQ